MRRQIWCFLYLLLGLSNLLAQEVPNKVVWSNFDTIKSYVEGEEGNELYLSVPWKHSVMDGQMTAAKTEKPILLWLYFGGPLGNC